MASNMKVCEGCQRQFPDHMVFCPFDGEMLGGDSDDLLLGRVLDSKYRLEEKLGEGGMGTVYRAKHILIDNDVAIKILHSPLVADRQAVARFQREATAAARIKHPNAVGVSDFGKTDDDIVYIVMELFIGQSLRELLEAQGSLPLERTITIARQVCLALDAAHRSGVIHRDIKPDNIVLDQSDQGDLVKVLDFGIAKLQDGADGDLAKKLTRQGVIVGSPHYLSPEQCQNIDLDARSDIYSLGIVLYEMLTGDVPFKAATPLGVAMMHATEKPTPPCQHRADIPETVQQVILRALEKTPDKRQQSAIELAQELEQACHDAEVLVQPLPSATVAYLLPANHPSSELRIPRATGRLSPEMLDSQQLQLLRKNTITNENSIADQTNPSTPKLTPLEGSLSQLPTSPPANNTTRALNKWLILGIGATAGLVLAFLGASYFMPGSNTLEKSPVNGNTSAPPPGMIYIKAGTLKMGFDPQLNREIQLNDQTKERYLMPMHEVKVGDFYLDKTEVSNQEYKKFLDATKQPPPAGWPDGKIPPGSELQPVTGITWTEANAYAQWAGKRLPTEVEWEYAARGGDGRTYPWGNNWKEGLAASEENGKVLRNVGSFANNASPFGVLDLAGNVWEWTADSFYLYPGSDQSVPENLKGLKTIRGGSFNTKKEFLTTYFRNWVAPTFQNNALGFRCAKSVPPTTILGPQ
jgi:eukaryotic-like serine/threonine-protein kinase